MITPVLLSASSSINIGSTGTESKAARWLRGRSTLDGNSMRRELGFLHGKRCAQTANVHAILSYHLHVDGLECYVCQHRRLGFESRRAAVAALGKFGLPKDDIHEGS